MFIHRTADMPRAGAEASVVSVPVLVLVGGVGRHLELRPDVDRRALRGRRCGGICKALARALARRLDPVCDMELPHSCRSTTA